MTDATTTEGAETAAEGEQQQEQTLTQADVNKLIAKVRSEERRKASEQYAEQYADYEELRTAAGKAKTLEERLADVEGQLTATQTDAMRTRIAAKFGISTEKGEKDAPSDADLFLTGSDEATLTAQAQRLAGRAAESKKQGNVAPKEGATTNTGTTNGEEREFVSNLFGGSD
jgi:hypothetical protein